MSEVLAIWRRKPESDEPRALSYLKLQAGLETNGLEPLELSDAGERLRHLLQEEGLAEAADVQCLREGLLLDIAPSKLLECVQLAEGFATSEGLELFNPLDEVEALEAHSDEVREAVRMAEHVAAAREAEAALTGLEAGAQRGESRAICELASRYYFGEGLKVDLPLAAKLYREAADLGSLDAAYNLGTCYLDGEGVELSVPKGIHWLEVAAQGGDPFAALRLGELYSDGRQVERRLAVAAQYFRLAEKLGHQDARKKLREIGVLPPLPGQ